MARVSSLMQRTMRRYINCSTRRVKTRVYALLSILAMTTPKSRPKLGFLWRDVRRSSHEISIC